MGNALIKADDALLSIAPDRSLIRFLSLRSAAFIGPFHGKEFVREAVVEGGSLLVQFPCHVSSVVFRLFLSSLWSRTTAMLLQIFLYSLHVQGLNP